jgi:hypothetical protein
LDSRTARSTRLLPALFILTLFILTLIEGYIAIALSARQRCSQERGEQLLACSSTSVSARESLATCAGRSLETFDDSFVDLLWCEACADATLERISSCARDFVLPARYAPCLDSALQRTPFGDVPSLVAIRPHAHLSPPRSEALGLLDSSIRLQRTRRITRRDEAAKEGTFVGGENASRRPSKG